MATTVIDGITTRYEVRGSGPAVLMFSPGGFDATLEKWTTQSVYARIKPVEHLSKKYTCIIFDRRETGQSGGRVERITWDHYMEQGKGLLDHLHIERDHVMGACMGCCPAVAFGVAYPEITESLLLYWPVGGAKYRINGQLRFSQHLAYVQQQGLPGVISLVTAEGKSFGEDPRGGPWASLLTRDPAFVETYARQDVGRYRLLVSAMGRTLFDRDTAPGAEPEDMLRLNVRALIVPGRDQSHATSAARYLEECLPKAEYWDVHVEEQTEETAPRRLLEFLGSVTGR
ncbi:MAG: alpha/beta hydrolase [Acidobacteria bacterium]|nr:alpha/beta hydrolase [Acidobacteriota bacterium]